MASRRHFLRQSLCLSASGLLVRSLAGCTSPQKVQAISSAAEPTLMLRKATALAPEPKAVVAPQIAAKQFEAPPDLFDAQLLDLEFWIKPRVLDVTRPASGERARLLYWKDGEILEPAYQQLCHLLRDVHAKKTAPIDPRLLETLWGAQAFVARYGMTRPLEILSGYRTAETNKKLIETGIPAARKSLHLDGRAADIRLANLNSEILGSLVRSFRQGGVGFYYRPSKQGGWIHADTGIERTWKG